jgi:CheY-like chemotaxis protein
MPKTLKILLTEDEPSLCRYIETLLSRWGCEVVVEQTAAGAVHRAAALKPDVALLGYIITPGVNGAEAGIELLRASPETRIVLTVESVPCEVLDGLRAQGYDFRTLAAPFKIEEFGLSRGHTMRKALVGFHCAIPQQLCRQRSSRDIRHVDSRRTRQQVGLQKFALGVKGRFNPFRDSAGCTIVMRWQRRFKSCFSESQSLF